MEYNSASSSLIEVKQVQVIRDRSISHLDYSRIYKVSGHSSSAEPVTADAQVNVGALLGSDTGVAHQRNGCILARLIKISAQSEI